MLFDSRIQYKITVLSRHTRRIPHITWRFSVCLLCLRRLAVSVVPLSYCQRRRFKGSVPRAVGLVIAVRQERVATPSTAVTLLTSPDARFAGDYQPSAITPRFPA